ncbi:MAG: universal stress protein, partial [Gemmatimonadota bacterium]
RYETQLVEAAPADGILRAARDGAADLVVMGTHGRTGLNRLLLGSVAERVVRESAVPVLTVRHDAGGGPEVRLPFRRILCPVNDTEVARLALRHAAAVAGRYGAELTLLACVESRQDGPDPEALLAELARDHAAGAYEVKTALRRGHAAEQVLQAAADDNSDLIVIGAQHRPLMETTIFGTTSVRVLRHAARPVLTVIRHER